MGSGNSAVWRLKQHAAAHKPGHPSFPDSPPPASPLAALTSPALLLPALVSVLTPLSDDNWNGGIYHEGAPDTEWGRQFAFWKQEVSAGGLCVAAAGLDAALCLCPECPPARHAPPLDPITPCFVAPILGDQPGGRHPRHAPRVVAKCTLCGCPDPPCPALPAPLMTSTVSGH